MKTIELNRTRGLRCQRILSVAAAAVAGLLTVLPGANAALIDAWRADDLLFNDGDSIGTWSSASNRIANGASGEQPILKLNVTPSGGKAVRFNGGQRMSAASSPVGGRTAFSVALVFRATAAGANNNAQWWGKTGLVDAEEPGVTSDWGTVLTEAGQVGIGTGNGDVSTYSAGASLVGSNYHVAVFTWGGGSQSVYVDDRPVVTQGSVSAVARNSAGISLGGIRTGEANRRLTGDFAEVRFYDTSLGSLEASNVIRDLTDTHILGKLPRINSFTASTNQIYLGGSVLLAWNVTNAISIVIDNSVGAVPPQGSMSVSPLVTTTYTLTATNTNGVRMAAVTVMVDPGVPSAFSWVTNTSFNTPVAITLRGADPQGSNLTYAIVASPAHGSLGGTPPSVTYTPSNDFGGLDTFTFKVNDGMLDSAPATVSISVVPPPLPPTSIVLSSTNIPFGVGVGGFIAGLSAIDINNQFGDSQTFALLPGYGDNAKFALSGNVLSAGPTFVGGLGATFSIRLRATDSTSLSYTQSFTLTVVSVVQTIVINEIHYNGDSNIVRDSFIELYNPTPVTLDVSQWQLRGGVDYFIPANTFVGPHAFLVVAEDPATILTKFGRTALGPWSGGLRNDGEEVTIRDTLNEVVDRVDFASEFPWPVAANGEGPSLQLVNPSLENDLGSSWRSGVPTPGATNAVFSARAAPNIRQVEHSPDVPGSTNLVTVTCKVTDPEGVLSVTLAYQVVAPGSFIPAFLPLTTAQLNNLNTTPLTNPPNPAFEAASNWVSVAMHDDGLNGDAAAGDGAYSAVLPQQANRSLVRYRITCTDTLGESRRAPFEDDPSLNFAYFVYDGIPVYQGVTSAVLQSLPVYSLITRDADLNLCTAYNSAADEIPQGVASGRNAGHQHFNWEGAWVFDGLVYDHITYRLRGANGRYFPGKRSFRFRFNNGLYFRAKDQDGNRYATKWREITTGKGQSNRGSESFALNEVVSYFLWNTVGVPAPFTHYFHFRVIRGASETGANQYSGDFWGLNWAQEKYDVNFLESHHLPKGNLYKLVDNYVLGTDERRYQAPLAPAHAEDFFNLQEQLTAPAPVVHDTPTLLALANYTNWYRYFTVAEAIRHYDIWPSANKNGAWYFEPLYGVSNNFLGRAMQLPYDTTDTWGPTWNNGEDILFNGIFPSGAAGGDAGQNTDLQLEYRNVVRELRTLLFQPDQINPSIDAHAGAISAFAVADYARWRNAPAPASYASIVVRDGGATLSPGVTGGLSAYVQDMKNFMFVGGAYAWWIDRTSIGAGGWITRLDTVAADAAIPNRPTITYAGSNGFPVDGLVFQSLAFSDPQGAGTFGAMQWRVAEIANLGTVFTNKSQLRLEWNAAWVSPEFPAFNDFITLPEFAVQPDLLYRVRVRHKDSTGRWSQWSLPVEFRPTARDTVSQLRTNLVFNEIMYNPPPEGATDGDEFEFLELKNIGPFALNLSGLSFSEGINFTFTNGTMLLPGACFLLARNPSMLATRYPGVVVNGAHSGRLNNDGETLAISHPVAGEIISLAFGDRAPWPVTADGFGFSVARAGDGSYRASAARLGTPGGDDGVSTIGGVVINEVLSSSTLPSKDTIEVLSVSPDNVDISGWYLSDDPTFPQKFRIPSRPALEPGEFAVFDEDDFNSTPGMGTSFSLSSLGDDVYLFSADAGGELTGYSHGFGFGAAQDGVTFGRYVNSIGEEQFPLQISGTFGATNSGPRLGPVVINEILYHPRAGLDEFIELRNVSVVDQPLFDPAYPTNMWKVNGIGFAFPTNVTLAAQGCLLLVADDPQAFRTRWNVPAGVAVFQYTGNLQDSGELLELQAPDVPTTNGVPDFNVDAVRYNDRDPWPLAGDGAGASLQRIDAAAYADDPVNWLAAVPTPGAHGIAGIPPALTAQPQSRTNAVGSVATLNVGVTGTEPLYYQWRFNGGNLPNATNTTLTLTNVQLSDAGTYRAVVFNGAGSMVSAPATLTVRYGVSITAQPTNVMVRIRPDPVAAPTTNATFNVSALSYYPPLRLQWLFNGAPIGGATNTSYTVTNVQISNDGLYSAAVSDSAGALTSSVVRLIPLITPVITQQPLGQAVVPGGTAVFSVSATGHPLPFGYRWRRGSTVTNALVFERTNFFSVTNVSLAVTGLYSVVITNAFGLQTISANALLQLAADADGDGMSDAWESDFGFNPTNSMDRDLDFDGDGASNWREYFAGTNPTNAASYLRIDIASGGDGATLRFTAMSNQTYSVQYSDGLPPSVTWSNLADVLARTSNRVEIVTDPNGTTKRFYRAVVPRQP